jgi:outer membrane protein, heavy metal efflux system
MTLSSKSLLLLLGCATLLATARVSCAMSMEHAVQFALANNLELRAATYEVEKARGRLIQAGLWPNPALELSHSSDRLFHNEGERTTTAAFQQAFPISGRLRHAKNVSRVELAQAMAEIRNRERLLIGEVQRDFLTVLLLREQITANGELLTASRDFADLLRQRFDRAEVSEVEVNLARADVQRLAIETAELESDLTARELALKLRLGFAPEQPVAFTGNLEALTTRFLPERYSTTMVVNRPDLRQTELGIDRAAAELRLARAEAWEDWTLGTEYEHERGIDEPRGLTSDHFLGVKISIPIALWNRNRGRITEQRAAAEQAQVQFEAQRLAIRSEIATALARARKLRGAVGNYRQELLPSLANTEQLLRRGYDEGLIPATQVIQVHQQQATLRNTFLTATANYLQALVDLETATASSPYLKKDFLEHRTQVERRTTTYAK